jgi:hypothetical protein
MTETQLPCSIALLVGNALRFADAHVSLTSGADGVRFLATFEDEELGAVEIDLCSGPGGTSGHFRGGGVLAPVFDDIDLVERTFPNGEDTFAFLGLQTELSFPHCGPFRRLRVLFVGVEEATIAQALIEDWSGDRARNVTHLPWTLESLTRFAAAHARTLPGIEDVEVTSEGQLTLSFAEGPHYVTLHNLLPRVRSEPEAATETIARFLASMMPKDQVDDATVAFRVMHAPHPVTLNTQVDGKAHAIDLASFPVGPDLSAVFVRDTSSRIAYLRPRDVEGLAQDAEALLRIAGENLVRTLPRIHIRGENNRYMLIAGGDYECSLALVPELWDAMAPLLDGTPVVAMPARDLCFITTDDADAIARLRARIDGFGELAYPISPTIYRVEKPGRWFVPVG